MEVYFYSDNELSNLSDEDKIKTIKNYRNTISAMSNIIESQNKYIVKLKRRNIFERIFRRYE